ncbi:MAG TPA: endonuclease/exonuclease/phosphatase family protein [Phycisphaerae bacterium]|nr:endonuclease/exonuclease/phosphatase family protein [Phycisphaerae bacterium]
MTFNIKFGERLDEALDVIRAAQPDVACLQEIKPSQVSYIEDNLGVNGYWAPSSNLIGDAAWGNAVFARGRLDQVQSLRVPGGGAFGVWATVEMDGGRFIVASVHLMHAKRKYGGILERIRETEAMLDAHRRLEAPAIIAGDFNEPAWGAVHRLLRGRFIDAGQESGNTLPAGFPIARVDYVFCSDDWEPESARTAATTISDHRPVVVVLTPNLKN